MTFLIYIPLLYLFLETVFAEEYCITSSGEEIYCYNNCCGDQNGLQCCTYNGIILVLIILAVAVVIMIILLCILACTRKRVHKKASVSPIKAADGEEKVNITYVVVPPGQPLVMSKSCSESISTPYASDSEPADNKKGRQSRKLYSIYPPPWRGPHKDRGITAQAKRSSLDTITTTMTRNAEQKSQEKNVV